MTAQRPVTIVSISDAALTSYVAGYSHNFLSIDLIASCALGLCCRLEVAHQIKNITLREGTCGPQLADNLSDNIACSYIHKTSLQSVKSSRRWSHDRSSARAQVLG